MKKKKFSKPKKRTVIISSLVMLAIVIIGVMAMCIVNNEKKVDFTVLDDSEIPKEIESQVLPEYRELERALACIVDDKVYIIVTRGEKATSGYGVDIEKAIVENGKMQVYASYSDPEEGKAISQVITYPYVVAKTTLKELPDDIELRIIYD